jgi:PAS domain S-box-containing protein
VLVSIIDITQRKLAEQAVEESEKRYNMMLMQSPFCFGILKGKDMIVTLANTAIKEVWAKGNDIEGKPFLEILPELINTTFPSLIQNVMTTGVPYYGYDTLAQLNRNGTLEDGYFNFVYQPYYETEETISGVTIIAIEVTKEVKAKNKIQESEERFRSLAEALPQMVWVMNGDGELEYGSQNWTAYSGIENVREAWNYMMHPDDSERLTVYWRQVFAAKEGFKHEMRLKNKEGIYRWFYSVGEPLLNADEKVIKWVGSLTDIHEQKTFAEQLEIKVTDRTAELNGKNEELEKMNKELQSFAYISSHDLQEPLRKIQIFSTRILESEENNLSLKGKDMFSRMQGAAKRMQTLIQDLLAYSRTSTEERKFEKTDLNIIVNEVREDLKEELKDKYATIEATALCEVPIIPFQFRQLLHNLISNSLKFSNPNNPPYIKIESEIAKGIKFNNDKLLPDNNYCHITVSDNGIGFDKQYSEKIFEVFQRLHGQTEYKGTGIGLAIVKKIAENHNGTITANGELNKGATFDIYFPAT